MAKTSAPTAPRPTFRELGFGQKLGWGVALLFALISAIWVWAGVADLLEAISTFGFGLTGLSWLALGGSIAAPIVTYAAGSLVAWKLPAWAKVVVFLVALAVAMVIRADLEPVFKAELASLLLGSL